MVAVRRTVRAPYCTMDGHRNEHCTHIYHMEGRRWATTTATAIHTLRIIGIKYYNLNYIKYKKRT